MKTLRSEDVQTDQAGSALQNRESTHLELVGPGCVKGPAHVTVLTGSLAQISLLLAPYCINPISG